MVVRIVKMTFQPDQIRPFQEIFEEWKARIRSSPGCLHLELLHDTTDPRIFFTYSHWAEEQDLENYRASSVLLSVWPVVKQMFAEPAQAWTVAREQLLP
jgi:(4S)-4-hydroxy-5-phosphonooxypentane-2,3-dione isomerase